jgi:hypothetical protein
MARVPLWLSRGLAAVEWSDLGVALAGIRMPHSRTRQSFAALQESVCFTRQDPTFPVEVPTADFDPSRTPGCQQNASVTSVSTIRKTAGAQDSG